jgi:hypothetical protein
MNTSSKNVVNSRGWRHLPPADLANLIMRIRRSATHRHLFAGEWREIDRMRQHHADLLKGAVL